MNTQRAIGAPAPHAPLRASHLAIPAAVALAALGYAGIAHLRSLAADAKPVQDSPGWYSADVVESDSPRARRYSEHRQLAVHLPDTSPAKVAVSGGEPQALLLPPSNTLADSRERALQAGAEVDRNRNVVLSAVTNEGARIEFVFHDDGKAFASTPRYAPADGR
ncbi:hypothetical protein [Hydrocarboniphaga sp.]|uniref:hypothetical protein n=1 Tax=Hydrocarboniphaga sp. TaxID=2033016 RepID=UPI003D13A9B2